LKVLTAKALNTKLILKSLRKTYKKASQSSAATSTHYIQQKNSAINTKAALHAIFYCVAFLLDSHAAGSSGFLFIFFCFSFSFENVLSN